MHAVGMGWKLLDCFVFFVGGGGGGGGGGGEGDIFNLNGVCQEMKR